MPPNPVVPPLLRPRPLLPRPFASLAAALPTPLRPLMLLPMLPKLFAMPAAALPMPPPLQLRFLELLKPVA
jgi:hypothetical protein